MTDDPTASDSKDAEAPLTGVIDRLLEQGDAAPGSPEDAGHPVRMAAGHPPPSPDSFEDIGIAHAVDGDGTALCEAGLAVEQVDHYSWDDIPGGQRCPVCAATLGP
jgi:hypothetical protein